jgi:hypothetical protein
MSENIIDNTTITTYHSGILLTLSNKMIFIPYKSIQLIYIDKKDTGWLLFIKASDEKYNLMFKKDITNDFINICKLYQ